MEEKKSQKVTFSYANQAPTAVLLALGTTLAGLSSTEARIRLGRDGENAIRAADHSGWVILGRQFRSPMVLLLVVALGVSAVLQEFVDAITIAVIVVINAILGFVQEYKSAKYLQKLQTIVHDHAVVRRGGKELVISRSEVVVGDIVLVRTGDVVPADIRLCEVKNFLLDESVLTGESIQVEKQTAAMGVAISAAERATNVAFMGTTVAAGEAVGVVIATGPRTVLGEISTLTARTIRHSSFDDNLEKFSKFILAVVGITLLIVFISRYALNGALGIGELFLFSIALAVSVIPEALPTVITITLSRGALQLAKEKVVVKRLGAIEDLGQIEILCTDKTGTLTQNRLTVEDIFATSPETVIAWMSAGFATGDDAQAAAFARALRHVQRKGEPVLRGRVVASIPFDPERRRSSVVFERTDGSRWMVVRGAPEVLLEHTKQVELPHGLVAVQEARPEILRVLATFGEAGHRTLGVAIRPVSKRPEYHANDEAGLTFLGIVAFADPLKPTSVDTLAKAARLGVEVKILTGDSLAVAASIAKKLELPHGSDDIVSGEVLDSLHGASFEQVVRRARVFARVTPTQKYRIIETLQTRASVGFLGEGMNDAPALKLANVAMVVQGAADVAKDASDVVLLEKDLHVIVRGIEQGRGIFANITKYLRYTLIGNFGNFFGIAGISLLVPFLPLLPLQILLANLLTDLPLMAVAADRVEPEDTAKPVRLNLRELAFYCLILGLVSTLFDFLAFATFRHFGETELRSLWLIESILTELVLVFSIRTFRPALFARRPAGIVLWIAAVAVGLTLLVPFIPFTANVFHMLPPTAPQFALILGFVLAYFAMTEIVKAVYVRTLHRQVVGEESKRLPQATRT